MSTNPQPLTMAIIKAWSPDEMKKKMADPTELAAINACLIEETKRITQLAAGEEVPPVEEPLVPVPTQEELDAQKAADDAAAAKAIEDAAAKVAFDAAKAIADAREAELKAAGISVEYDQQGNILKIVKVYQAKDEAGNPISRPTHLEAKTWVELSMKQQAAHENAVRFAERLKKQKTTFKKDTNQGLSDEELLAMQEALKGEDRDKAKEAAEKIRENDRQLALREAAEAKVAFQWMSAHLNDYYPCQANSDILKGYIENNGLEFTYDNLELAFAASEGQLALKPAPIVAPQTVNPVVVPPAAAVPPAAPAAPVVAAPPANPVPPARPGVNASLQPGQNSAPRPAPAKGSGLTKKDIAKWTREEMRKNMANPTLRAEIDRVLAAK